MSYVENKQKKKVRQTKTSLHDPNHTTIETSRNFEEKENSSRYSNPAATAPLPSNPVCKPLPPPTLNSKTSKPEYYFPFPFLINLNIHRQPRRLLLLLPRSTRRRPLATPLYRRQRCRRRPINRVHTPPLALPKVNRPNHILSLLILVRKQDLYNPLVPSHSLSTQTCKVQCQVSPELKLTSCVLQCSILRFLCGTICTDRFSKCLSSIKFGSNARIHG